MATTDDTATRSRQIAYQLLAEGKSPTWRAVHERLGRGSSTTINAALREFWSEVGQRLSRPDLPPEVAELCQALWQRALDRSDDRWSKERETLTQDLVSVRGSLASSEAERSALVKEVERLRGEVEDRDRKLAEASKQAEKLIQQRDKAREAQSAAELAAGTALSRERAREKDLNKELERVCKQLAKREMEFAQMDGRWQQTVAEIQQMRDRVRGTEAQLAEARQQEREVALGKERAEAEAGVLRGQVEALMARVGG